jgi:two-component system catabolic regulation response regulator CreB/two-component system response regulator ChvI
MLLKLNDFSVIPYMDPEQACADFEKDAYDLILLEVRMSKISGFALCHKIKKIDPRAKFCFMTNERQQYLQEFKRLFPELTDDYLVDKPASGTDLLKILENHFGK